VRFAVALLAFATLPACYDPQVKDRGYLCNAQDPSPCPDGYQCVNGFCDNGSSRTTTQGVADGSTGDSATRPPDLAGQTPVSNPDLSSPDPTPDLSPMPTPGPDMTPAPSCVPTGGDCTYHNDAICCSSYCIYKTNTCK
jgi:hypothetical protein